MRALVLNVKHTHGFKKADKSPYEMFIITVALPLSPFSSANYSYDGFGFDTAELPIEGELYSRFADLKEPRILELQVEPKIVFGDLKNVVVSFSAAVSQSAPKPA